MIDFSVNLSTPISPMSFPPDMRTIFDEDGFIHLKALFSSDEVNSIKDYLIESDVQERALTEHLPDGFQSWRGVTHKSENLAGLLVAFACFLISLRINKGRFFLFTTLLPNKVS